MRVRILPAGDGSTRGHPLTGLLVDGVLAVDAGPLGLSGSAEDHAAVTDVLLTHSHIDHVAGLPVFLDTVYRMREPCPAVHALPHTLDVLRSHLFNDLLMPDFVGLSETLPSFLTLHDVTPAVPFSVGRYAVTAFPVEHTIPTVAYLIDDGEVAIAVVTDTSPVPTLMEQLANAPRLRAVFLECSFPRRMADLARLTTHHTTYDFAEAALTFPPHVCLYAIHVKPRYAEDVEAELREFGLANVQVAEQGRTIEVPC